MFHDKNFASLVSLREHWPRASARVIWSHILCPLCPLYHIMHSRVSASRFRASAAAGGHNSGKPQKFRFIDQVTTANVLHIHGKYAQNSRKAIIIIHSVEPSLCTWHTGVCNKYTPICSGGDLFQFEPLGL
jgi:hypothetical protein